MPRTHLTAADSPAVAIDFSSWDVDVTRTYEANRVGLMAAASRIVGQDHAADVVQDAVTRVWSRPSSFDPLRGTLTRYLYLVVRGVSIDRVRTISAQRARDVHDAARTSVVTASDQSISQLIDAERAKRVKDALALLRPEERDAITAAFYLHLTYQQVAVRLGVPEGTVKSRIRLGLIRLRRHLETAASADG